MSNIKIEEQGGTVKITIKPNQKGVVSFVYTLLAIVFAFMGICCVYLVIINRSAFTSSVITILSLAFSYAMLQRTYSREQIILEKNKITLRHFFVWKKSRSYRLSDIENVKIEGEDFASHDLDRKPFDYHGIGTEQENINNLISSGRLVLICDGTTLRIGRDLYLEEADTIASRIRDHIAFHR